MTGKKWVKTFLILSLITVVLVGTAVFAVDPFFHYRKPNDKLYYWLNDQRCQNDGITRHFEYDSIITGTSMAENFKSSEFDSLFGTDSIKVCYSGATYKEINDNLKAAFESGHQVRYVLRVLDYSLLVRDKDEMRTDMGEYPEYLTNDNLLDDVKYLLNREVILNYTLPCLVRFLTGHEAGHTSFDEYSFIVDETYGRRYVLWDRTQFNEPEAVNEPTQEEMKLMADNIAQNVTELAKQHPETEFIYFFPPYSMAYWAEVWEDGDLNKMLEYVKMASEQILECDNIHLYNFAKELEITENLDIYRDAGHYNPDINSWMIKKMAECEVDGDADSISSYRLTKENVEQYYEELAQMLSDYDYNTLIANE